MADGDNLPAYRMIAAFIIFWWLSHSSGGQSPEKIVGASHRLPDSFVSTAIREPLRRRIDRLPPRLVFKYSELNGKVGFGMALSATMIFFPVALAGMPEATGNENWQSIFYILWDSIFCVGIDLGLLTLFRKRFNRQRRLGKFLSTHAYAVYIIHAPVIVAVAIALTAVSIHPLFKFGQAVVVGVPLCFRAAYLVRKLPFASNVL